MGHLGAQMIQWKQALNQETVDLSYLKDQSLTHWITLSKSLQPEHFSLLRRELGKFTTEIKLCTESLLQGMQWTSGHLSWPALCLLLLLCPSVWVLPLFHFILVPEAASPNYIFSAPVMAHDSAHLSECLSPYRY